MLRTYLVIGLIIAGFASLALLPSNSKNLDTTSNSPSPEITKIKSLKNPTEQSNELTKLLERVGPIDAQEQMLRSGLPFTGQTHLLIHTVGDYIYNKFGKNGLSYCRDYFLSACYHGFILNTLGDYGMDGMSEVMENCLKAGSAVESQCAHGSGHGFVAWHDYDLAKALKMCDELGENVTNFPHFNCYDGVFMENIWGVHDGAPSEKRWVKGGDFNYPCNDPRIEEKYRRGCWANQATLVYQYVKGDLKKTAQFCDDVDSTEYKEACYNNFSRQIHPLTEGRFENVISLCRNATGEKWQNECILTNMSASWAVGDRKMPFELCTKLADPLGNQCFDNLAGMIKFQYAQSPKDMSFYCDKIPSNNKAACTN